VLPADACPYHRPFPPDFTACSAFQPRPFVALDLHYRPLPPVVTCQHLQVKATVVGAHRYYGRCGIGDAAARQQWVEQVRSLRLRALREVGAEINRITRPLLIQLWEAKGRQLEAHRLSRETALPTAAVREVARRMRTQIMAVLQEHRAELESAGLPYETCRELVDAMLERFVSHPSTDVPLGVPPELLARFPEAVRIFFEPQAGQPSDPVSTSNPSAN
jgi:hypothetical protein